MGESKFRVAILCCVLGACSFDPPPPVGDSGLAALTTSAGVLDPAFDPDVLEYDLDLLLSEDVVSFTPTVPQPGSMSITLDGAPVVSGSRTADLAFDPGTRDIPIAVERRGAIVTYTVHVHRGVDALAGLEVAPGAVAPAFAPEIDAYTLPLLLEHAPLDVTPTLLIPDRATVAIDDAPAPSGAAFSLTPRLGAHAVDVTVLPATRDPHAYTLDVQYGTDALGSLELAVAGVPYDQLVPAFDPETQAYSAEIGTLVTRVEVRAAALVPGSTVEVNGVELSPTGLSIDLLPGTTTVTATVSAASGERRDYSVSMLHGHNVVQRTYVKPSNAGWGFGRVAISGNVMVVGAPLERGSAVGVDGDQAGSSLEGAGAAYVFRRTGNAWVQEAYLKASNTGAMDWFGSAVAVDGDVIAVAAPGDDSGAAGIDGDDDDTSKPSSGAVFVFRRRDGAWAPDAYLKASNPDAADRFGTAIALSGDTLVVGAVGEDSASTSPSSNGALESGAAYVFQRRPDGWEQEAYLKASNPDAGDGFGGAVAIWGDLLVIGASGEASAATTGDGDQADDSAPSAGAAYVFHREDGTWSQDAYLKASNAEADDQFGAAVAVWDDTIVVGAPGEDSKGVPTSNEHPEAGAAYVFVRLTDRWLPQYGNTGAPYFKAFDGDADDRFGTSVALWGRSMVIGAPGDDHWLPTAGGAIYYGMRGANGQWGTGMYLVASNGEAATESIGDGPDRFGECVALFADTIVVGAPGEDGASTGIDGDQEDDAASGRGAAYVFR